MLWMGATGVYSARYAGRTKKRSMDNMDKLMLQLKNQNQTALPHFKTVIALNLNNQQILFSRNCERRNNHSKRGERFWIRPIFKPKGIDKTFCRIYFCQLKNEIVTVP